ncbi:MAG: ParB N-terminal domain-containing protein [Thermoproteales archaeon]|nr:ParB N-terminal domain-containing protein [Thermoproteales archaeon]
MSKRLLLSSSEDSRRRAYSIAKSFALIYDQPVRIEFGMAHLKELYATEPFLEDDKLALVARKYFLGGYSPPLVVLRSAGDIYLIDGHHRAYLYWLAGVKRTQAYILSFEDENRYTPLFKLRLRDLTLKHMIPPANPILRIWHFMIRTLYWLKKRYGENLYVVLMDVPVSRLVPTQAYIQLRYRFPDLHEPILVTEHKGKYYIIDGHTRGHLVWLEKRREKITALVVKTRDFTLGIVKTAERMGFKGLSDLKLTPKQYSS